jgi:hypothetical protein
MPARHALPVQTIARALAVWLLIILAESVHGTLRTLLLVPVVGDFPARQISVFTGAVIIFAIAWFTHRWMFAPSTGPRHVKAVIPSEPAKSCHSGEGWSRGFEPHAARLRNSLPMQGQARPARWNPILFDQRVPLQARAHLIVGTVWVILTITFEITLGRALGMPWSRILEDYNLMQGGLMPIGLLAMWATPWTVGRMALKR